MTPYKTVLWNDYQDEKGEKWFAPEKMPDPHVNSYYKILMKTQTNEKICEGVQLLSMCFLINWKIIHRWVEE